MPRFSLEMIGRLAECFLKHGDRYEGQPLEYVRNLLKEDLGAKPSRDLVQRMADEFGVELNVKRSPSRDVEAERIILDVEQLLKENIDLNVQIKMAFEFIQGLKDRVGGLEKAYENHMNIVNGTGEVSAN